MGTMTTTFDEIVEATVTAGEMTWKAYGTDEAGKAHFVTFGTPGSYTRTNVRAIAERLLEKKNLGVSLVAIRRADVRRAPWVKAHKFYGQRQVSKNWEG